MVVTTSNYLSNLSIINGVRPHFQYSHRNWRLFKNYNDGAVYK
jgi:hypothetical protein